MFLAIFKQRVRDSFIQIWNSELAESSMARFFRNTSDFGFKAYLNIVTVKKFRRALSRLRMSSHRLEVEMGRWKRPVKVAYGERKYRVYGVLEDEFHFLIECPIYVNLRAKYIKRYYYISPSMYKLVELFSTNNNRDIQNLATYVYKAGPDSVIVRAFASEAGGAGSNPGRVIPKTLKMVPVATLLGAQH